jgi:photosystem II stability/assembly factor-like uncharacterized protein
MAKYLLILQCILNTDALAAGPEYSILAPLASHSLLLDAATAGDAIVVVGERGHILLARDATGPWIQSEVPTRATLTAIFFHNEALGWVVGHDATILRTDDGGRHWKRVYFAPEEEAPLLDIWFKDAKYGIAIGAYGLFLTTEDGGMNWARNELKISKQKVKHNKYSDSNSSSLSTIANDEATEPFDFHLNNIVPAQNGQLYIAAEAGKVFRSNDHGRSWESIDPPYNGSFYGVLPLDGERLLSFGLRGHLYRSENAGKTWRRITSSTREMLTDGLRLSRDVVVIVGLGGAVIYSHDGGRSFSLKQQLGREGYSAIVQSTTCSAHRSTLS